MAVVSHFHTIRNHLVPASCPDNCELSFATHRVGYGLVAQNENSNSTNFDLNYPKQTDQKQKSKTAN